MVLFKSMNGSGVVTRNKVSNYVLLPKSVFDDEFIAKMKEFGYVVTVNILPRFKCVKCKRAYPGTKTIEYLGENYCEDCYNKMLDGE